MSDDSGFNDAPIEVPQDDRFGMDPFARALATSISKIAAPEGSVIALNGPWGAGKSSAANLVLHHLRHMEAEDPIEIVKFSCWWFRGEEALALAFFQELYAATGPSLTAKAKSAVKTLGSRLLSAGSAVGSAIDLSTGASGGGAVVGKTMDWLGGLIEEGGSVEKAHGELSKALLKQNRRFLIVIDDIDRLSPDEALLIFRLVKSVGRLPNVIYLLVYDRQLAEKIITERFPAEGAHYLEKIVQAAFEIPEPHNMELSNQLLSAISEICGEVDESRLTDFFNHYYEAVAPELKTPRDLHRIANTMSVTWPAVAGEVDLGDFIALETLRLRRPKLHRAIRMNRDLLCKGQRETDMARQEQRAKDYERIFLSSIKESERSRFRDVLMRLFPLLNGIWGNVSYGGSSFAQWARNRRVCSKLHFDTYFRFCLGAETLSKSESDELVARAGDAKYMKEILGRALEQFKSGGGTRAALVLEELNLRADEVSDDSVQNLLSVLFSMADELDVEADMAKGFDFGSNGLRIHRLMRRLTFARLSLEDRTTVFQIALQDAALGWVVHFADSAYDDYFPREGEEPEPESNCLVTTNAAEEARNLALRRVISAAESGVLEKQSQLGFLLYRWRDFAEDNGDGVRDWTNSRLHNDEFVGRLAEAFTGHSWTQGFGDHVARRHVRASVDNLESIIDVSRFRSRLEEIEENEAADSVISEAVSGFLEAWRNRERGRVLE